MALEGAQDGHLFGAEVLFHPGAHELAGAVVVAERAAIFQDPGDDVGLEAAIGFHGHERRDEDKVEIGALGVEVGSMGQADGAGPVGDESTHAGVDLHQAVPGHGGLQGVDEHAHVVEIVAHVWIEEAAVGPLARRVAAEPQAAQAAADAPAAAGDVGREMLLAVGLADEQAALVGIEPAPLQKSLGQGVVQAVGLHGGIGLFGIGDAQHGGHAEFALGDAPGRLHGRQPVGQHVGEAFAAAQVGAEDLQGHGREHAEGPFAALHDVVDLGPGGRGREVGGGKGAYRRDILLAHHQVAGIAVVAGLLARAQGRDPAAHRGELEGLGKVAAGVALTGRAALGGVMQVVFVGRPQDARLHGDRLVGLVEGQHPVHVGGHHQGHPAPGRFHSQGHRRTAAEDRQRNALGVAVGHDGGHVLLVAGMEHQVAGRGRRLVAQPQHFFGGLAVGVARAGKAVLLRVFRADDGRQARRMDLIQGRGRRWPQLGGPRLPGGAPWIRAQGQALLEVAQQAGFGVIEAVGGAPLENGAVGVAGRRLLDPLGPTGLCGHGMLLGGSFL